MLTMLIPGRIGSSCSSNSIGSNMMMMVVIVSSSSSSSSTTFDLSLKESSRSVNAV